MNFNSEQLSVIDKIDGPLLVLAPAGTGKTTILAERIRKAINKGISPEKMLCLTFTNLAAKQLRDRVAQYEPDAARQIWMGTFHGFCALVLYKEAKKVGLPSDYVIYDEEDSKELLKKIMDSDLNDNIFMGSDLNDDALAVFGKAKSNAIDSELTMSGYSGYGLQPPYRLIYQQYAKELRKRHAMDFSDLIYYVRAIFANFNAIKQKWMQRFSFIQIDEIQDTHMAEYDVIKTLSQNNNVAFFGDLDQSIYGWRGAMPVKVKDKFISDFKPKIINLHKNYRATKKLLLAADSFSKSSFRHRFTNLIPDESCEEGNNIKVHLADTGEEEADWICSQIEDLTNGNTRCNFKDIAILCRTNNLSRNIGKVLEDWGIPCLTVDQYQFFKRQEIKDALSFMKLILNPYDISAAHRIALRFVKGFGKESPLQSILSKTEDSGLFLSDFFNIETLRYDDPFGRLVDYYYKKDSIMVLDTETTGLTPSQDNIIQIAYQILHKGKPEEIFNKYLKSTKSVGSSFNVHKISDDYLLKYGEEPNDIFETLRKECKNRLIVGHNIKYDISMINSHAHRCGIDLGHLLFEDTYEIARRLIKSESYRLEDICRELELNVQSTHNALDDVLATVELVHRLIPRIDKKCEQRKTIINKYKYIFEDYANKLEDLRRCSHEMRPVALLQYIMEEFNFKEYYRTEKNRLDNLDQLLKIFEEHDRIDLIPFDALHMLVQYVSLAQNLDHLVDRSNNILVAPIHQSKGLEFKSVFIAGAVDGFIPIFRGDNLEEEKRLFYVAITRAKRNLFITGFRQYKNFNKKMTPFLDYIDRELIEY
ncbi:MAG: UvrD-helicase domain-containing protein [Proteobacteria bacterium]|nr:UvrD-helicase domain-containing protein [Pseudomonadota bacterium]